MRNNIAGMSVVGESPSSSGCGSGTSSWSKLLECGTDLVENMNTVSVINNQALWDHIRTSSGAVMYNMQGGISAGEMKEGWMNSAVNNDISWTTENNSTVVLKKFESGLPHGAGVKNLQTPNSFGSLSNYGSSNNGAGKLNFQAGLDSETFPCGPFTRLLDPATSLDCADSMELGIEDLSASKNNPRVQHQQLSSHNVAAPLKAPTAFQSSNILTFHSNMNKLDMAAYSASKPATNTAQNQKAGGSPSDSSPSTSSSNNTLQKSTVDEGGECTTEHKRSSDQVGHSNISFKKSRTEASNSGPMKVRKEKLGERITALQQLVSPFGKTDTASVLLEAMGYIRFLQEQVQVLSTPYLKGIPSAQNDQVKYDLRSRGLCLVPVACTLNVANNNGADFWTSGLGSSSKF